MMPYDIITIVLVSYIIITYLWVAITLYIEKKKDIEFWRSQMEIEKEIKKFLDDMEANE